MEARVSTIVPAYNEAPRITRVLDVLTTYKGFSEVIVVDDGSTDATAAAAEKFKVRVVQNKENFGKGAALDRGVKEAQGNILFFCDADIKGLSRDIIDEIVGPVARGEVEMFVGSRNRARYSPPRFTFIASPLLDGQRALTRELWDRVTHEFKHRFQIESALNYFAQRSTKGFGAKVFNEITQVTKEEKYGFFIGKVHRFVMYTQIIAANRKLHVRHA